nr:hypothetical protein [Mycoplasmopsis bovis]
MIENGEIKEQGTHNQLMSKQGLISKDVPKRFWRVKNQGITLISFINIVLISNTYFLRQDLNHAWVAYHLDP